MTGQTVGDHLLARMHKRGVEHMFGYPGDGSTGGSARGAARATSRSSCRARHEEMAAVEAIGYTKSTGRTAVCAAPSRPGAIHLLSRLYDAKLDHVHHGASR